MSKKCIWCGGMAVYLGFAGVKYYCPHCEEILTEDEVINDMTVFEQITQSPETLAEKLVYEELITEEDDGYVYRWRSTILPNDFWYSEEKAIAATMVKLKEVMK